MEESLHEKGKIFIWTYTYVKRGFRGTVHSASCRNAAFSVEKRMLLLERSLKTQSL
jgi:hypothetical protein